MKNQYLPLTEYSSKYRVSISTLRRRIKSEDIHYLFEDGKYLIYDQPVGTHPKHHRPSQEKSEVPLGSAHSDSHSALAPSSPTQTVKEKAPHFYASSGGKPNDFFAKPEMPAIPNLGRSLSQEITEEENLLSAANRLLSELKKAYTQILHEKEEQIMNLKEETADLKTLVKVLESENERLQLRLRPEPGLTI